MPALELGNQPDSLTAHSLEKLRTELAASAERERENAELFLAWQAQWENSKTRLIHRLDVIDQQLARMAHDRRTSPRLTIVTADDLC